MIDIENEVFTIVATAIRTLHAGTTIKSEYVRSPAVFPTVSLCEIDNVNIATLADSSGEEKYAGLGYRLQVFSNKEGGKKSEAKAIFKTADHILCGLGFRRSTYSTTPEIYNSTIFSISATYEAIVDKKGTIFRR